MSSNIKNTLLVLSIEEWNSLRKARKQLLYKSLIKFSNIHKIIYVEPMSHWWLGDRRRYKYKDSKIYVIRWLKPFPYERYALNLFLNRYCLSMLISKELKRHGDDNIVGVFYHPYNWLCAKHINSVNKWVFDWTEDWCEFHGSQKLSKLQNEAVANSFGVSTVSQKLFDQAFQIRGRDDRILHLPNATSLSLAKNPQEPKRISGISHPRIGYFGHMGPWFDFDLFLRLTRELAGCQWCIFGYCPQDFAIKIDRFKNVHYFGTVDYMELPNWMVFLDVLVAPYKQIAEGGDSSKIYDYLSSGKPIVSTPFGSANQFGKLVKIACGVNEWKDALQESVMENDILIASRRKKAASENTWDKRAKVFKEWILQN